MRVLAIAASLVIGISSAAAAQDAPPTPKPALHAPIDRWDLVPFEIHEVSEGPRTTIVTDAVYQGAGATAKFRLELTTHTLAGDPAHFTIDGGRFIAVRRSNNATLLAALRVALSASTVPARVKRVAVLPFTAVEIATRQTQTETGWTSKPVGDWLVLRVALPGAPNDCELVLNINGALHVGQFTWQDPANGDCSLQALASVL